MTIFEKYLSKLLRSTRKKRLRWVRKGPGKFATVGRVVVLVREVVPLVAGPTETIGCQAFEIQTNHVQFSVWAGTLGEEIVHNILAAGFPDWAEHQKQITKRLIAATREIERTTPITRIRKSRRDGRK